MFCGQNHDFIFVTILCFSFINSTFTLDTTYLLPTSVVPLKYNLTLEPLLHAEIPTFIGSVIIQLKIVNDTNNITLHANHLNVTKDSVTLTNDVEEEPIQNITTDKDRQFLIVHFENTLKKNTLYTLTINSFTGYLGHYRKYGFYLATYQSKNNGIRILAVTQFQPSGARAAFPCFDEPKLKATFLVNVIRAKNYTALSNEELFHTQNLGANRFKDTFKETVLMSTYLVAIVVCDFGEISLERHRMYAKEELIETGGLDHALQESVQQLKALENYFETNYTLDKVGHVLLPSQYFNLEAMENWGLIIYKEYLIAELNYTRTFEHAQTCSLLIAHELSHNWFGNLVTPKYWKYYWLSEGFASYLQYKITSLRKPNWRLMEQYVKDVTQAVFQKDIGNKVHPLNYDEKFDELPPPLYPYQKGSAVVRMMNHFLTEVVFHKGLQIYLQKHSYQAVEPSDLYASFQEALDASSVQNNLGNNSVSSIMNTWDTNLGYPLITVTRDYTTGLTSFEQTRYLNFTKALWKVPINYALEEDLSFAETNAQIWLCNRIESFVLPKTGWILVNKHVAGLYRVNYDLVNWDRLAKYLLSSNYKAIPPVNRGQLLFDSFSLASNDLVPYHVPLNLTKYLIQENDYVALLPFYSELFNLKHILRFTDGYHLFERYTQHVLNFSLQHLGFEENDSESVFDKMHRSALLSWFGQIEHPEIAKKSLNKIKEWKNIGTNKVPPDLKESVMCLAMINAPVDLWEFLYHKFQGSNEDRFLKALTCSRNRMVLRKWLETVSPFLHKFQTFYFLTNVLNSNVGVQVVFEYLKDHTELPTHTQTRLAYALGSRFTTNAQMHMLEELAVQRNISFELGINEARKNINRISEKHVDDITNWLKNFFENNLFK